MARPLNKKFFGNRNIGTGGEQVTGDLSNSQNYSDDRIGGEGVGSVTINNVGGYLSGLPTATFSTPVIPGGVRATGIVHGNAKTAATTSNGTGYRVGDVLTVAGGTRTSAATFPVAAIVGLGTPTITSGGSLYDVTNPSVGDKITFTHANFPTTPLRVRATAVSGSTITQIVVEQQGIWTGTGAFPTSMANGVNGFTAQTSGGPVDNNGAGLTLSFDSSNWGLYSFGTVAVQGDYTVAASNPVSFTGGTGSGAAATIDFGVSGIEVTEEGSGYTSVSDAAITFGGVADGGAVATPVLTTDSNSAGTLTNQENAIIVTAFIPTANGGSAAVIGDIVKQSNDRRYKVKTAEGTGICQLKTTGAASAAGEMSIKATDSAGGNYLVAKLTARKVVLVPAALGGSAGTQFASGASAKWTFGSAVLNDTVTIENA